MTAQHPSGLRLDDLPIPEDAAVTARWPAQMVEMADHIGAHATLRLIDRYGGSRVRVPLDPARAPFGDVLGGNLAAEFARIYGGNELQLPTAKAALAEARRAPVLASVRNGDMTVADAAKLLGTARTYVSELVNRSGEARGAKPLRRSGDDRQFDLFRKTAAR